MPEQKTKPTTISVEAFLNSVDNPTRREDGFILLELFKTATKMEPRMWGPSIVGFGQYHYKYASGHEGDCCITGFSPRKESLSIYVIIDFDVHADLWSKLGKYRTGKSCLYINKLADIDQNVLSKLIKETVAYVKKKYPQPAGNR